MFAIKTPADFQPLPTIPKKDKPIPPVITAIDQLFEDAKKRKVQKYYTKKF